MTESLRPAAIISDGRHETTRALDTAVGILVGWRRCSTYAAFRELVAAGGRHRVPVFALASALVKLASGEADGRSAGTAAQLAAEQEWGAHLLV